MCVCYILNADTEAVEEILWSAGDTLCCEGSSLFTLFTRSLSESEFDYN